MGVPAGMRRRHADDPAQFRVFVNTKWAITWKVKVGKQLKHETLYERREEWGETLPAGVIVLTAGVDLQESPSRLEVEVKGWGVGEESWGIAHKVFHGLIDQPLFDATVEDDPMKPNAWRQLDEFLSREWVHPLGVKLRISCTFVDSSHRTKEVYQFIRTRQARQIYAIKGSSERGAPIVNYPTRKLRRVLLIIIGTDAAKSTIYDRLQKLEPGPGYLHWPKTYEENYFKQVVAEHLTPKMKMGQRYNIWELPAGHSNEGLDLNVYAYAALCWMTMRQGASLERLSQALRGRAEKVAADTVKLQQPTDEPAAPVAPSEPLSADHSSKRQHVKRARGFVRGWR